MIRLFLLGTGAAMLIKMLWMWLMLAGMTTVMLGCDSVKLPGTSNPKAAADNPDRALAVAYALPRGITLGATNSRQMLVNALYQATVASGDGMRGKVTMTGTLNGVMYSPEPTDRLVVQWLGETHEFVIKDVQGNAQAMTADQWLINPHKLNYTHTIRDKASADINVNFDGQRFTVTIKGHTTLEKVRYDMDLTVQGQTSVKQDLQGMESSLTYDLTGNVTQDDLKINVDERHTSTFASYIGTQMPHSMRGSASRTTIVINSSFDHGGAAYRFDGVRVVSDHKTKGFNTAAGVSDVSGHVKRDGAAYGKCILDNGDVKLQIDGGEMVKLTIDLLG